MYQSGDRKREQVSTNHDAKNRKVGVGVEETPRMKQAAQLQAMADDFVDAKAVVQRRRVTVFYKGGTVIGHDTENLTLSQLQNLLMNPNLTQQNTIDIEAAIANGEYSDAPNRAMGDAMDVQEDAPKSKPAQQPSMEAPKQNVSPFAMPQPMAPPPARVSSQQGMSAPPLPQQQMSSSPFAMPAPKNPSSQPMGPPPSRFPSQQVNMGPSQPMGPPPSSPFAMPAPPMGRGKSSASAPRAVPRVPQEQFITLYRGLNSAQQGKMIQLNMSAGGENPKPGCGKPSEQSVVAQVGMDDVHPNAKASTPFKRSDVTEYTSSLQVAMDNDRGGGVISILINSKYLSKGDSGSMQGWIAQRCAPIEKFNWLNQPKPDDDPDAVGT